MSERRERADMGNMQTGDTSDTGNADVTGTRGILNPGMVGQRFTLTRLQPSPDLRPFIERYWIVAWDLRGQEPHIQETLPYPCAHLVFEAGFTRIYGVMTGKYARELAGWGRVLGVKFRPAGFYPLLRRSMSTLTNKTLRFEEIFGEDGAALESAILAQPDEGAMAALAEDFLRPRLPEPDERVTLLNRIVTGIAADREITSVGDALARCEGCATSRMSRRTLQRLFSEYIGVGPKWVIRRFRLHEAAGRIDAGDAVDWPRLALELGYSDQTHFIKDFKAIVGQTPTEYGGRRASASNSFRRE